MLLVACPALAESKSSAQSTQTTPATEDLPVGYATQTDGSVRWTYPIAAEDEVRSLRASHAQTWHRIVAELGGSVPSNLDIRIAVSPEEMRALAPANTSPPSYADGFAVPERGLVLLTLTEPETFLRPDLQAVLTHELSHIALYRATRGAPVPRWFLEGVAVQQAQANSLSRTRTLWEGTLAGKLLSLDSLAVAFPATDKDGVELAYAEGADFVGFMLSGGDERARFRSLLRELAQGKAFPDAVQSAYHVPVGYMEREWRATLTQRFGRWPVLFMGLTSIWVLGAVLLVVGYARARARHRSTMQRWAIEEAPIVNAAVPPAPPPAPTGATQSTLDDFFDNRRAKNEPGVPTVVHDGQSYTLH